MVSFSMKAVPIVWCIVAVSLRCSVALSPPVPGAPGGPCTGSEVFLLPGGKDYRGTRSTTVSGYTCQNWLSQVPHAHDPITDDTTGVGNHNFCRNAFGTSRPGCFTTEAKIRYEDCDVGVPCDPTRFAVVSPVFVVGPNLEEPLISPVTVQLRTATAGASMLAQVISLSTNVTSAFKVVENGMLNLTTEGVVLVKTFAVKGGMNESPLSTFRVKVLAQPMCSAVEAYPPAIRSVVQSDGKSEDELIEFVHPVLVTLTIVRNTCNVEGTIVYTTTGDIPTRDSPVYTGPFWIKENSAVTASVVSTKTGAPIAPVVGTTYRVSVPSCLPPTIMPDGGDFYGDERITFRSHDQFSKFYIRLNVSDWTLVEGNSFVLSTVGVTAVSYKSVAYYCHDSPVKVAVFVGHNLSGLRLYPPPGVYMRPTTVTLLGTGNLAYMVFVNGTQVATDTIALSGMGTHLIEAFSRSFNMDGHHVKGTYTMMPSAMEAPRVTIADGATVVGPFTLTVFADPEGTTCYSIDKPIPAGECQTTLYDGGVTFQPRDGKYTVYMQSYPLFTTSFLRNSEVKTVSFTVVAPGSATTSEFRVRTVSNASLVAAEVRRLLDLPSVDFVNVIRIGPYVEVSVKNLPGNVVMDVTKALLRVVQQCHTLFKAATCVAGSGSSSEANVPLGCRLLPPGTVGTAADTLAGCSGSCTKGVQFAYDGATCTCSDAGMDIPYVDVAACHQLNGTLVYEKVSTTFVPILSYAFQAVEGPAQRFTPSSKLVLLVKGRRMPPTGTVRLVPGDATTPCSAIDAGSVEKKLSRVDSNTMLSQPLQLGIGEYKACVDVGEGVLLALGGAVVVSDDLGNIPSTPTVVPPPATFSYGIEGTSVRLVIRGNAVSRMTKVKLARDASDCNNQTVSFFGQGVLTLDGNETVRVAQDTFDLAPANLTFDPIVVCSDLDGRALSSIPQASGPALSVGVVGLGACFNETAQGCLPGLCSRIDYLGRRQVACLCPVDAPLAGPCFNGTNVTAYAMYKLVDGTPVAWVVIVLFVAATIFAARTDKEMYAKSLAIAKAAGSPKETSSGSTTPPPELSPIPKTVQGSDSESASQAKSTEPARSPVPKAEPLKTTPEVTAKKAEAEVQPSNPPPAPKEAPAQPAQDTPTKASPVKVASPAQKSVERSESAGPSVDKTPTPPVKEMAKRFEEAERAASAVPKLESLKERNRPKDQPIVAPPSPRQEDEDPLTRADSAAGSEPATPASPTTPGSPASPTESKDSPRGMGSDGEGEEKDKDAASGQKRRRNRGRGKKGKK